MFLASFIFSVFILRRFIFFLHFSRLYFLLYGSFLVIEVSVFCCKYIQKGEKNKKNILFTVRYSLHCQNYMLQAVEIHPVLISLFICILSMVFFLVCFFAKILFLKKLIKYTLDGIIIISGLILTFNLFCNI